MNIGARAKLCTIKLRATGQLWIQIKNRKIKFYATELKFKNKKWAEAHFLLDRIERSLLVILLDDLLFLNKVSQKVGDALIRQLGEGRDLLLKIRDALKSIRGGQVSEDFSLERHVLKLSSGRLARSRCLANEKVNLIIKPFDEDVAVFIGKVSGGFDEVADGLEQFELSHGMVSF